METRIERLCVERGLRLTGQRRVIARVLSESSDHPDVEELYRRAVGLDPKISIATVYRTVRLFEEKGILERRDFGGGRARYEASPEAHHDHLTGLLNRAEAYKKIESMLPDAQLPGARTLLGFADLDNLKKVNDAHGHPLETNCCASWLSA